MKKKKHPMTITPSEEVHAEMVVEAKGLNRSTKQQAEWIITQHYEKKGVLKAK